MARDALAVLARVRNAAATEAKRKLASTIAEAHAAGTAVDSHARDLAREQNDAVGDDVAAFAAWLPAARARGRGLADRLEASEGQVIEARQALMARKTEAEAVGKAIERRVAEKAATAARKDQEAMDQVAGRRRTRVEDA